MASINILSILIKLTQSRDENSSVRLDPSESTLLLEALRSNGHIFYGSEYNHVSGRGSTLQTGHFDTRRTPEADMDVNYNVSARVSQDRFQILQTQVPAPAQYPLEPYIEAISYGHLPVLSPSASAPGGPQDIPSNSPTLESTASSYSSTSCAEQFNVVASELVTDVNAKYNTPSQYYTTSATLYDDSIQYQTHIPITHASQDGPSESYVAGISSIGVPAPSTVVLSESGGHRHIPTSSYTLQSAWQPIPTSATLPTAPVCIEAAPPSLLFPSAKGKGKMRDMEPPANGITISGRPETYNTLASNGTNPIPPSRRSNYTGSESTPSDHHHKRSARRKPYPPNKPEKEAVHNAKHPLQPVLFDKFVEFNVERAKEQWKRKESRNAFRKSLTVMQPVTKLDNPFQDLNVGSSIEAGGKPSLGQVEISDRQIASDFLHCLPPFDH